MWLLVRDGIRRWWWMIGLVTLGLLFAVFNRRAAAAGGMITAVAIVYGCIMMVFCESLSLAKFRVVAALPVGARQRGLANQALFIWIFPLLSLLAYALEALAHVAWPDRVPVPASFPRYLATVILAAGATCLFVQASLPSIRYTEGWKKLLLETVSGTLAFCLLCATLFFVWRLGLDRAPAPFSPQEPFAFVYALAAKIAGPHPHPFDGVNCSVLTVAGAALAYTFLRADAFGRFLSALATRRPGAEQSEFVGATRWTCGFLEPWHIEIRTCVRLALLMAVALGVPTVCLFASVAGSEQFEEIMTANGSLAVIIAGSLLCLIPVVPWIRSLRTLRMLPLSRNRLALYLISFSVLAFTFYSLALLVLSLGVQRPHHGLDAAWALLVIFGCALLAHSLSLMTRRALPYVAFLILPCILAAIGLLATGARLDGIPRIPLFLKLFVTAVLLAGGYLSTHWALRRSNPYRASVSSDLT